MKKISLWNIPAGRITFIFTAISPLLCIYLFPTFLNNYLFYYIQGAEGSAGRMVLRALISPIAIILFCIPLLVVTRRRLLDLNLSNVFLFAFPVWPLAPLAAGPFWAIAMFPMGGQQGILLNPDVWFGIICLSFLALMPGRIASGPPKWAIFQTLQRLTETDSQMNAAQFRKTTILLILGTALVLSVLSFFIRQFGNFMAPIFFANVIKIVIAFIVLVLTANTIRRLNDIGRSYLWSAFIPLFLPRLLGALGLLPLLFMKGKFSILTRGIFLGPDVLRYILMLGSIGCCALLIWLMFKKTSTYPIVRQKIDISDNDTTLQREAFFSPAKIILASLAAIMVSVTFYKIKHPYDYYRYRMTVTIETPEGLKTGYAVRQGNYEQSSKNRASWAVGEAVAIDLGERGLAFALIDSSNIGDGVSFTTTCNLPEFGRKETPVGKRWVLSPGEYPRLVTFTDPRNPKTMESLLTIKGNGFCGSKGEWEIQNDRFEEIFGEGVRLKEIALEITNSPVTTEIEKYLPWLHCRLSTKLKKSRFTQKTLLDKSGFKRYSREHNLKKMRAKSKEAESPVCTGLREEWIAYDRQKFQDEINRLQPRADQGDAEAQFNLAKHLEQGDGQDIAGDYLTAVKWYTLSAAQGYQAAQVKLAEAYKSKKTGMPYDPAEAYYWASLAALSAPGDKESNLGSLLRNLPDQLTPKEQETVKARVRAWIPPTSPDSVENTLIANQADLSKRLLDFAYEGNIEIAKLLVERGADINIKNSGGNNPLMLATMKGRTELITFLIDKGADIHALNNHGWTALFMAAQNGHTESARVLLENGIDANVKDTTLNRSTAMQVAQNRKHMATAAMIAEYLKNNNPE